jgi:hypothetical protein
MPTPYCVRELIEGVIGDMENGPLKFVRLLIKIEKKRGRSNRL